MFNLMQAPDNKYPLSLLDLKEIITYIDRIYDGSEHDVFAVDDVGAEWTFDDLANLFNHKYST